MIRDGDSPADRVSRGEPCLVAAALSLTIKAVSILRRSQSRGYQLLRRGQEECRSSECWTNDSSFETVVLHAGAIAQRLGARGALERTEPSRAARSVRS